MRVLNKYKLILCEVMLGMDFGQQQMLLFLSLRKNAFLKDSKSFACSLISIPKTGVRKC